MLFYKFMATCSCCRRSEEANAACTTCGPLRSKAMKLLTYGNASQCARTGRNSECDSRMPASLPIRISDKNAGRGTQCAIPARSHVEKQTQGQQPTTPAIRLAMLTIHERDRSPQASSGKITRKYKRFIKVCFVMD